jgi:hypothetical protein
MAASMAARWHRPTTAAPNRGQAGAKPHTTIVGGIEHTSMSRKRISTEFVDELVKGGKNQINADRSERHRAALSLR